MSIRDKLKDKKSKLTTKSEPIADHPALLHDYQDGDFYQPEIDQIVPDPNQPRKYFDQLTLEELAGSIKEKGVLQPVLIRQDQENNKIYLVAGERRFRAAKMAGLEKIPAIFTTGNPAEISLIENLQRENLKPIEEAEALAKMIDEHNYTQENLAKAIGKSRSTITHILSMNRLPEQIKKESARAHISKRVLIEIAKLKTPQEQLSLFARIKDNGLTSDHIRKIKKNKSVSIPTSPTIITKQKISSLINHLKKIDFEAGQKDEKKEFYPNLQELKLLIDQILK